MNVHGMRIKMSYYSWRVTVFTQTIFMFAAFFILSTLMSKQYNHTSDFYFITVGNGQRTLAESTSLIQQMEIRAKKYGVEFVVSVGDHNHNDSLFTTVRQRPDSFPSLQVPWYFSAERNGMHSALQTLFRSMHPRSESTPAFLVRVVFRPKYMKRHKGDDTKVLVSIDNEGRFQRHDIFSGVNISHDLINHGHTTRDVCARASHLPKWDASSNGMFCSFSSLLNYDYIALCHPSLKWRVSVLRHPGRKLPREEILETFLGAYFDDSTSHFHLLIGYLTTEMRDRTTFIYKIHLYSSMSQQWRTITRTISRNGCRIEGCTDVFSDGCFFWMSTPYVVNDIEVVVGFSLKDKQFHVIDLPYCPIHPNGSTRCKGCKTALRSGFYVHWNSWALKGCHDNVVLFHSEYQFAAWRLLVPTESQGHDSGWKWQRIDFNLQQNLHSIFPATSYTDFHFYFDTHKSGWWLWAKKCLSHLDKETDLKIFDSQGELRHTVSMGDLTSVLDVPDGCHVFVDGVWPFEANNIWSLVGST